MRQPKPYQRDLIEWMAKPGARFNAADPGLGKTMMSILAAHKCGARRIGVIAPKTLLANWQREMEAWWPDDDPPLLAPINYDLISREGNAKGEAWLKQAWDVVIADEAHALKNPESNRTRAFYRHMRNNAGDVWLLSGTPAPNHAGELWPHLRALRPDLIPMPGKGRPMTYREFCDRYCITEIHETYGWRVTGNRRMKELRQMLEESSFFRRTKKADVLPDLDPMIFDTFRLDRETLKGGRKLAEALADLSAFRGLDGDALLGAVEAAETALSSHLRMLGLLKAPAVTAALLDELDVTEKVVVFARHRDVMTEIQTELERRGIHVSRIDGSTPAGARQQAVDQFQHGPARVFLGQIKACGEGLTLTAAHRVYFAETTWTPSETMQAASRCHRIGQKDQVIVNIFGVSDTIDDAIARVVARKSYDLAMLVE